MDDIELERNHSFQQNTIDNFDLNVSSSRLFPNNFNSTIEELIEKSLSISHVNIRSLYKNFDSLQELYEENFKNKFKLIGLSEIWNVKDIDHFRIPGYNLEIQCRAKQRGGGVGAYIHSSLNYSRINNISLINAESIWLKLNLMNQTIIMGVVYRKPGTNFEEFKQEFEFVLQNLNLDKKLTIIMGDFNVDLTSDEEKSRELIRLTESYGLVQLIKTATRVTNTSSTLIDHIYTRIFRRIVLSQDVLRPVYRTTFQLMLYWKILISNLLKKWCDDYEISGIIQRIPFVMIYQLPNGKKFINVLILMKLMNYFILYS